MADRDDIKHKLREFPPRKVAALALRAAMRVLPVLAMRGRTGGDPFAYWPSADRSGHVLAILRCYQISTFGQNLPEIDSATIATYRAATTAAPRAEAATTATIRAANAAAVAIARTANAASRAANTAAFAAALAAIRAARTATRASATDAALNFDLEFFRRNGSIKALLSQPLWPGRMPDEIEKMWLQLIADLRSLHDYYDVWIIWYQERLEGRPMHPALEKRWALLPDYILHREPAEINTYLMRLWGDFFHSQDIDDPDETPSEIPDNQEPGFQYQQSEDYHKEPMRSRIPLDANDPAELPPEIPEIQEPGFQYPQSEDFHTEPVWSGSPPGIDDPAELPPEYPENQEPGFQHQQSEDSHSEPHRSGFASPDDAAEIAAMRSILIKAVDNLVSMASSSNELAWVGAIASDYRDAIIADGQPIDDIYGYGAWLENAYDDVKAMIATKNHPNLAPGAAAAINTIIAIHGPMIASTARGQELMARARNFAENQADTAAYKLKAQELAAVVRQAQDAAAKDVSDEIEQANDNIDHGPQQGKS